MTVYEYWADWNHHGSTPGFNTEPVFVYYLNGRLYAEASRVHYQWRVKMTGFVLNGQSPVWTYVSNYDVPALGWPTPVQNYTLLTATFLPIGKPPESTCGVNGTSIIGAPSCPSVIDPFQVVSPTTVYTTATLWGAAAGLGAFVAVAVALNTKRVFGR
jgi:hypothetical protein